MSSAPHMDGYAVLRAARDHLTCAVCMELLRDPVAFPCSHLYCRACASRALLQRPRCPLCNHSVPNSRRMMALPPLAAYATLVGSLLGHAREALPPPSPSPPPARRRVEAAPSMRATQRLTDSTPTPPPPPPAEPAERLPLGADTVAAAACDAAVAAAAGPCALCGLDTSDRRAVRRFLRLLLQRPEAGCTAADLGTVTEASLARTLGPLVACGAPEGVPLAHHNCLAWAGYLPFFYDPACPAATASGIAPAPDTAASAAAVASKPTVCTICGGGGGGAESPPFATGLRRCRGRCCRRSFHFLCAVLAGPQRAVAYGLPDSDGDDEPVGEEKGRYASVAAEVWCGACARRRPR